MHAAIRISPPRRNMLMDIAIPFIALAQVTTVDDFFHVDTIDPHFRPKSPILPDTIYFHRLHHTATPSYYRTIPHSLHLPYNTPICNKCTYQA